MPEETSPGIYRLPIPLPDSPLGTVNIYAVHGDSGLCLIDCGWDTPEAYEAVRQELAAIGCAVTDVREILVTHIHPDHFGLAGRIARESGAAVSMHRLEAVYVGARYGDVQALLDDMETWLRVHGVTGSELDAMTAGSLRMVERVGTRKPDLFLEGSERITWGQYDFEVIWTPGHSAGLVCLYDRRSGVLISSDHVLPRISPHVGLHTQSSGNPLADYLSSLNQVRNLPVKVVLPGHGAPFRDLGGRVDELIAHHRDRLDTMSALLDHGERTAYEVASGLRWRGSERGWERLAPFQRRIALTETIAHLEYMVSVHTIDKQTKEGSVTYAPRPSD